MKVDLYNSNNFLLSVCVDLSVDDIAVVSRKLLAKAACTAEGFEELFQAAYKYSKNHSEAYLNAEKVHREIFGKEKYSSYDVWWVSRANRLKIKK